MISIKDNQKGIGILEIMIALMLLAIAVLGFAAMQMTAVKATDESVMRTRALAVMRGGAEVMRVNNLGIASFKSALNDGNGAGVTKDSCYTKDTTLPSPCTIEQLAARDALVLKDYASKNDLTIRMVTCPGTEGSIVDPNNPQQTLTQKTQERQCLIASWGNTTATIGTGDNDCVKPTTGIYNAGAKCLIMEAY